MVCWHTEILSSFWCCCCLTPIFLFLSPKYNQIDRVESEPLPRCSNQKWFRSFQNPHSLTKCDYRQLIKSTQFWCLLRLKLNWYVYVVFLSTPFSSYLVVVWSTKRTKRAKSHSDKLKFRAHEMNEKQKQKRTSVFAIASGPPV